MVLLLQILLCLIMLNMLLAIVMSVYDETYKTVMSSYGVETLWSQTYEIFHQTREWLAGRLVRPSKILRKLDKTDLDSDDEEGEGANDEMLTVNLFIQKCQKQPDETNGKDLKLKEHQAVEILSHAHRMHVMPKVVDCVALQAQIADLRTLIEQNGAEERFSI